MHPSRDAIRNDPIRHQRHLRGMLWTSWLGYVSLIRAVKLAYVLHMFHSTHDFVREGKVPTVFVVQEAGFAASLSRRRCRVWQTFFEGSRRWPLARAS